jgi:hypothetical protein
VGRAVNLPPLKIEWSGGPPPDRDDWEAIVRRRLKDARNVTAITLAREGDHWRARADTPNVVAYVTKALARARKPVIGRVRMFEPCRLCGEELHLFADGRSAPLLLCVNRECPQSLTGERLYD